MSYTTVKAIWPGERSEDFQRLSNSWGSAPVVWDALCEKYKLGKHLGSSGFLPCYLGLDQDPKPLWALFDDKSVPLAWRVVLGLTFDRAYVERVNYRRAAKHIQQFLRDFPPQSQRANHWPWIANFLMSNPAIPAIGLHCTSVSEDPYVGPWNETKEEYDPFDWNTAFEVYAQLLGKR